MSPQLFERGNVTCRALLSDFEIVAALCWESRDKRQQCAGSMMSAAGSCDGALLWGVAAATSPGMCAVNDFWEDIYLYQDIVLRRIAVGDIFVYSNPM